MIVMRSSCRRPLLFGAWKRYVTLFMALTTVQAFAPRVSNRQSTLSKLFSDMSPVQMEENASFSSNLDASIVREWTEEAIRYRGQPRGLAALERLGEKCSIRTPYDFSTRRRRERSDTVLELVKDLIPSSVTAEFLAQVRAMEQNGWLSTNPDSVDGLPSLHLNLVSDGQPVSERRDQALAKEFQEGLDKLLSLIAPYIYDKLLPSVKALTNDPSIRISDVFLRRYGQDILEEGNSRNGLSAHYDVFSKVTSVIAMDDSAASGTNGLYTTDTLHSKDDNNGSTSNHASLRRFFPLEKGDGVVHSWDVLHGVDTLPDTDRTSLIIWFTTEDMFASSTSSVPPWLKSRPDLEADDIAQFVLGCALEATETSDVTENSSAEGAAMLHQHSRQSLVSDTIHQHPHDLYLKSASFGNAFALAKLADLTQVEKLSLERAMKGLAILEDLRATTPLGEAMVDDNGALSFAALANRFWFEAAVRGNPVAQASLADNVMERAALGADEQQDLRLLAAVLFGLAAQQGNESACESLGRVVQFEVAYGTINSQEDFESSAVVRTANLAIQ